MRTITRIVVLTLGLGSIGLAGDAAVAGAVADGAAPVCAYADAAKAATRRAVRSLLMWFSFALVEFRHIDRVAAINARRLGRLTNSVTTARRA